MKAILINQYYISRVVIKIGWLIITHKYIFIFLIVCRFNFYACLSLLAGLLQFLFNHFLHSFNLFVYIFCIFDVFLIAENFFLIIIKFYQLCVVLVKIKSLSIKINLAARASWYFKLIIWLNPVLLRRALDLASVCEKFNYVTVWIQNFELKSILNQIFIFYWYLLISLFCLLLQLLFLHFLII